jgi:disulfide bond formation protein DsbB
MINWLLFNIHLINLWYSIAGLAMLAVTFILIFDYVWNNQKIYNQFVSQYVWVIIMLATIGGAGTTLLYSEILGFIPCSLCWLQRVALYPQVFLVLTAFKLKDTKQFPLYGIVLSIFGLIVAVYQYIYQALPQELHDSGLMPCLADGSADCSKKVMELFGFVTFPFLSAVTFAFLIILYLHLYRSRVNKE